MPASKTPEPIFGRPWFDVAETVRKRRSSLSYLSKDTFDSVLISVTSSLKSEPDPSKCSPEVFRTIYDEYGNYEVMSLLQLFGNIPVRAVVVVENSRRWSISLVRGFAAAYGQNC